jgi:hypothetical protein
MKRASGLIVVIALACTKHEPELERVGGPELDASSDVRAPQETSGATEDVLWCQALAVLEPVCQRCHQNPPLHGAPFPLVTYENTQASYFGSDVKIWAVMQDVVASDYMPATFTDIEPPIEPLTCEQKTTLLGWLEQGAKDVGGLNCTDADKTLAECGAGGAGGAGSEAGSGGASP